MQSHRHAAFLGELFPQQYVMIAYVFVQFLCNEGSMNWEISDNFLTINVTMT